MQKKQLSDWFFLNILSVYFCWSFAYILLLIPQFSTPEDTITIGSEVYGLNSAVNWSFVEHGIVPEQKAFRNLNLRRSIGFASGKAGMISIKLLIFHCNSRRLKSLSIFWKIYFIKTILDKEKTITVEIKNTDFPKYAVGENLSEAQFDALYKQVSTWFRIPRNTRFFQE